MKTVRCHLKYQGQRERAEGVHTGADRGFASQPHPPPSVSIYALRGAHTGHPPAPLHTADMDRHARPGTRTRTQRHIAALCPLWVGASIALILPPLSHHQTPGYARRVPCSPRPSAFHPLGNSVQQNRVFISSILAPWDPQVVPTFQTRPITHHPWRARAWGAEDGVD